MREKSFVPILPLFNLVFLGLGWPWAGEFVGFIVTVTMVYVFQPNIIWQIASTVLVYLLLHDLDHIDAQPACYDML